MASGPSGHPGPPALEAARVESPIGRDSATTQGRGTLNKQALTTNGITSLFQRKVKTVQNVNISSDKTRFTFCFLKNINTIVMCVEAGDMLRQCICQAATTTHLTFVQCMGKSQGQPQSLWINPLNLLRSLRKKPNLSSYCLQSPSSHSFHCCINSGEFWGTKLTCELCLVSVHLSLVLHVIRLFEKWFKSFT